MVGYHTRGNITVCWAALGLLPCVRQLADDELVNSQFGLAASNFLARLDLD
jgi:hypothetical protein